MVKRLRSFLFENKTTRQTVAKNTFWLFFGNITSRLIRVAIIVYAARILGASGWGAFAYALSLAAFFTIFIDFGINAVITRETVRNIESQGKYFATALVLKILMLAAVVLIIIFSSPYLVKQSEVMALVPLVALIVGFDSLRDFGATLSRAWEKMEIEAFVQIFTNILIVTAGFIALIYSPTPKSLALGYAIGTGGGMVAAFYPFRNYLKSAFKNFSKSLIKPLLYASWPFGMMSLMGAVMLNTDTIMIGWFRDIASVGYYSAGQRVAQLFYIIPTLIISALFPAMARFSEERAKFREILEKSMALLAMLAIPLTAGSILVATDIIKILYGAEYLPAVTSFKIMSLTYIPVFLAGTLGNAIFAFNLERVLFGYALLGIFGNFVLNLLLIPYFGIAGAALSTVLNQIIIWAYLAYKLKKKIDFKILSKLKKIMAASAAMIALILGLLALNANPYFLIITAAIFYFAFLLKLKDETLLEVLELFLRKRPD